MQQTETSASGFRVLVIEDHADAAQAVSIFLRSQGYTIELAASGLSGIERARTFGPEVVICDLALPDIDGFEVARRIRGDKRLRNVRLIAFSAYLVPERARDAGFDGYITKPANLERLGLLIHELATRP